MAEARYGNGYFFWRGRCLEGLWHRMDNGFRCRCGAVFKIPEGYLLVTPVGFDKWATMTSKGWIGLPVGFLAVDEGITP